MTMHQTKWVERKQMRYQLTEQTIVVSNRKLI